MKQLSFKIKAYRRRKHILHIVKKYAREKKRNPKTMPYVDPRFSAITQGIVLSAYICSLYKHKNIDLWRELRFFSGKKTMKAYKKIDEVIEQSNKDGFVFEPEYICAKRSTKYIFTLMYAYRLIKIPLLFKRGYTNF